MKIVAGPVLDYERFVVSAADRSFTTVVGTLSGLGVAIRPVNVAYNLVGLRR
jgi:hypothetical protein